MSVIRAGVETTSAASFLSSFLCCINLSLLTKVEENDRARAFFHDFTGDLNKLFPGLFLLPFLLNVDTSIKVSVLENYFNGKVRGRRGKRLSSGEILPMRHAIAPGGCFRETPFLRNRYPVNVS